MSTRGAYGFRLNNTDYVEYNHYDSYPSSLGVTTIAGISGLMTLYGITGIKEKVATLTVRSQDYFNTKEGQAELAQVLKDNPTLEYNDPNSTFNDYYDHYWVCRGLQGSLLKWWTLNNVSYVVDSSDFLLDSLFCEWAYIVNLDTEMLEVYKGFNTNKRSDAGRYADKQLEDDGYYGVALLAEFPLFDLPTPEEFLSTIKD